jgi:hypothetical protein
VLYAVRALSAFAHAALSVFVGAATATPAASSTVVPPPRPVASPMVPYRPPPARPIAVAVTGIGTLGLACGLSLVAIGIDSRKVALDGRTEGEVLGRTRSSRRLLAVGIPLASVGLATAIAGIVWIARDRRRAKRLHGQSDRQ